MFENIKKFLLKLLLIGIVPYCILTLLSIVFIIYGAININDTNYYIESVVMICIAIVILIVNYVLFYICIMHKQKNRIETTEVEMK